MQWGCSHLQMVPSTPGGLGLRLQRLPVVRGTCRFFWGHHMWVHTWQAWGKATTVLNLQSHPRMTEFSILLHPKTWPKPGAFWKILFSLYTPPHHHTHTQCHIHGFHAASQQAKMVLPAYIDQAGLELMALSCFSPPECWKDRCTSPHLVRTVWF